MSNKILVTGGAGFIGSHIVEYLLSQNKKVRVIDNLSTGSLENISHLLSNKNLEFIKGDISDIEIVRLVCEDVYIICNQAAIGSVPRSINDPLTSHINNVDGFLNILLVAKEKGIKRIVYASSSSVYGDSEILPKKEDTIGNPLSPYAITKYINELYANLFTKLYGLECIGLRYFNVFGPRQNPNGAYAAVIPKFINLLLDGKQPIIHGNNGENSRDFTYIQNVVMANNLAMFTLNENCFGTAFNIGAGGKITILELFSKIKKYLNSQIEPIMGESKIGDVEHSCASIDKSKELLEYVPEISFDDGLEKTIEYFVNKN